MKEVPRQTTSLPYDALLKAAKDIGLRRLEATVLRFPSAKSNYAVCSATLEADIGVIYRETATVVPASSSGTAQATALDSACVKAKALVLEAFTGIKCKPTEPTSEPAQTGKCIAAMPTGAASTSAPIPLEPCAECGALLTQGNVDFSMKLFKRPLCVACQINTAASN